MGDFPSGQRGQTVNLLSIDFGGPNPPSPTKKKTPYFYGVFLFWCEIDGKADEQRTASGGAAAPSPIPSSTDADGMLLNRSRVHQKKTGFNLSFFIHCESNGISSRASVYYITEGVSSFATMIYNFFRSWWYAIPCGIDDIQCFALIYYRFYAIMSVANSIVAFLKGLIKATI